MISTWKLSKDLLQVECVDTSNKASLNAVSILIPEGCYTTFRTYADAKVLAFNRHVDRLVESASLAGTSIELNKSRLKHMLKNLIPDPTLDWRVRITVDLEKEIGITYISMEPLPQIPASIYQQGIDVTIQPFTRQNPKAKMSGYIRQTADLRRPLNGLMKEVLLIDNDGYLTEGLTSNFFAVMRGIIHTSSLGVLHGVTRGILLEIIQDAEMAVQMTPVSYGEIGEIDEAFISSASRGILPIRRIDHQVLSSTVPGEITASLMVRYQQYLGNRLEAL